MKRSRMQSVFLSLERARILFFKLHADPKALAPFIPPGTELLEEGEGAILGLTGSLSSEVTHKGIRISGDAVLPHIELRCYVRWKLSEKRYRTAAVLLEQLFPQKRNRFLSKYLLGIDAGHARIDADHRFGQGGLHTQYSWQKKGGRGNRIRALAEKDMDSLSNADEAEGILAPEAYFFPKRKGTFEQSSVEHEAWKLHTVIEKDFAFAPDAFPLPRDSWKRGKDAAAYAIEGSTVHFSKPRRIS